MKDKTELTNEAPTNAKPVLSVVAKDDGIICPKCKTDRFLKSKRYLMFHKLCTNCLSNVQLRNHPYFGK